MIRSKRDSFILAGGHRIDNCAVNLDMAMFMRKVDKKETHEDNHACEDHHCHHYVDIFSIEFTFENGVTTFWGYPTKKCRDQAYSDIICYGYER